MSFSTCLTMRFEALGLPLPWEIKVTVPAAIAAIKILADCVEKFGPNLTFQGAASVYILSNSPAASVISDIAVLLGAAAATITVSFYLGALIVGCIYCGYYRNDLEFANINSFLHSNKICLSYDMKNYLIDNSTNIFNQMSGSYRLA